MRRKEMLERGLAVAADKGFENVTRADICKPRSLVNYYFGGMSGYRAALLTYAVDQECLPVIAQLVARGLCENIPDGLRRRAIASLSYV